MTCPDRGQTIAQRDVETIRGRSFLNVTSTSGRSVDCCKPLPKVQGNRLDGGPSTTFGHRVPHILRTSLAWQSRRRFDT